MTQVVNKDAAGLVCVMLDVHIWSGRRHLEKTDLIHANPEFSKLPEKDLANLGSVKICDPDDIKKFQAIKGRAERAVQRAGLPILGATGVPLGKFDELHLELKKCQSDFRTLEDAFVKSYDDRIEDWKQKHVLQNPAWARLFREIPTAKHVAGRLGFDFHAYRISAPSEDLASDLNTGFQEEMGGLKGKLLDEVAAEASKLMSDYLMGRNGNGSVTRREYVTPKTLGPLKRSAMKLKSFSFLDPSIGPLADWIDSCLAPLPVIGQIRDKDLVAVWSIARALSSPTQAIRVAEKAASGSDAQSILFSIDPVGTNGGVQNAPSSAAQDVIDDFGIQLQPPEQDVNPQPAAKKPRDDGDNLAAFL